MSYRLFGKVYIQIPSKKKSTNIPAEKSLEDIFYFKDFRFFLNMKNALFSKKFLEHGTVFHKRLLIQSPINRLLLPTFLQKYSSPHLIDVPPPPWDPQDVQEASACLGTLVARIHAFLFICLFLRC